MSRYSSKRSQSLTASNNWYRAVTPTVGVEDRDSHDVWKRAYDSRHMSQTSLGRMHMHVGECMEQNRRTHCEKLDIFRQHSMPNLTWMDLDQLRHDRSLRQRQPCYFADVGGPQRLGVNPKRSFAHLDSQVHVPRLNLFSKTGGFFGK
mmetsp:Transcript_123838/g.194246  ORF Transcript_123838/g.194246 Transcript_123838/m.194246 type:complete len:148 (+) Transcript_123838:78-521(+)